MDRKQLKEIELENATAAMQKTSSIVKQLSEEVKRGMASKVELEQAMQRLRDEASAVKIKQQETKILSGWEVAKLGDTAFPKEKNNNIYYIIITVVALWYLASF